MSLISKHLPIALAAGLIASAQAEIQAVNVPSVVMNREIPATVTLPDGYRPSDAPRPVLYLLHGAGDRENAWCDRTPVQEMADSYGVIIVSPRAELSWYFDSPVDKNSQFETFVSSELVKFVDSHYRTLAKREGRALAGNSMGGHGAMFLAVRHKDLFSATAPMSGAMDIRAGSFPEKWGIKQRLGTIHEHPERWDELTVINQVDRLKDGELAISIECGDKDMFLEVNRQLDAKLTAKGITHRYAEHPGGHNWNFWKLALPRQMAFLDKHFKKALAPERVDLEGRPLASVDNELEVSNGDPRVVKLGQPNLRLLRCGRPSSRGTVLLFPGGGYHILAITKEGSSVAQVLNEAGYDVAILEYSIAVPDARDKALAEALQAVRLLRERGTDLQLHTGTLGVMGFSAGGHLAARTMHALGAKEATDFAILIYPAYLDRGQKLHPDVTPPTGSKTSIFALIADNDQPGWVTGTKAYIEACRANGQVQELHLLHGGGHGFGITANMQAPLDAWPDLLRAFLNKPFAAPKLGDADYPKSSPSARFNEKVKAIKSGQFDLALIGDSITETLEGADGEWTPLKAVWDKHFAPRKAINLGYSGYRTENLLWQLQNGELDFEPSPKAVVLLIGTNNTDDQHYPKTHTAEQVFVGTKAIVELIRQRHPTTKILVLRIFPSGGPGDQTSYHRKYNRSAKATEAVRHAGELTAQLADGNNVFWLDIGHVFLRPDGCINTDLMPDMIHPNVAGAEAWAQAIEPMLAKLMGDQPIVDAQSNTAVVPVPKLEEDGYDWFARHDAILAVKGEVNPDVVFIGDSITHAWGGTPTSGARTTGESVLQSAFADCRTLNLGFGWDRTQNVLWRIDHGELDGIHPRAVVLHIGTNNTSGTNNARQNSAAEIVAGIRTICIRIRAKQPETQIILMSIFPREEKPDHPRRKLISEINRLLAAEFNQTRGITLVDIGPKFLARDGALSRDLTPDFCHPNAEGYQIWADALAPLLK